MKQSALTRTLAAIGMLSVSFLGYDYYSRRMHDQMLEQERQKTELERQRAEKYKAQLRSVLAERKTTRFRVLRTEKPPGQSEPLHTLRISQWNTKAEKVFSRDIQVTGNKIYFEGVVVHFRQEVVADGKANVHLLRRVFSDTVPPSQGVLLIEDQIQAADKELQSIEVPVLDNENRRSVQRYIQRIVADPAFAKAEGVRTVNGEAVCDFDELSESFVYTLVEKADGGYLIEKAPIP
jgi:hypothetical protein